MLDITVCILSYNRCEYLRESLLSVLSQKRQPQKIVIYDNGSDKGVYENVKDLLSDRVHWVGAEFNHSFIWNFGRAMNDCESRYVMMFHDDDKLCPNFLESQLDLLEKNADIVAISCNGHFIDEKGIKIGKNLALVKTFEPVELFTCSGHVAKKYAANSCIPLSPAIYRTEVVRTVKFREEYGKVCDAVFFCDLADIGTIAYQTTPLYECRLHIGQDSNSFPFDLLNQLEDFYWSRRCLDDLERNGLHTLLLKQHAARNLKRILLAIKKLDLLQVVSLIKEPKFKIKNAILVIGAWGVKKTFGVDGL